LDAVNFQWTLDIFLVNFEIWKKRK
jgi:hypothetical protein